MKLAWQLAQLRWMMAFTCVKVAPVPPPVPPAPASGLPPPLPTLASIDGDTADAHDTLRSALEGALAAYQRLSELAALRAYVARPTARYVVVSGREPGAIQTLLTLADLDASGDLDRYVAAARFDLREELGRFADVGPRLAAAPVVAAEHAELRGG